MNEKLKIIISAEIAKLKQAINEGKRLIDNFSDESKAALSEVGDTLNKAGEVGKKAMKVMATAVTAAATALLALGASSKEFRQSQALLKTAFETAGGSAESAKKTYNDLYRVLGDTGRATEAAQHLAKLTTNEKELAEWTKITKGVYATFSDSLSIEGLTEAVNHTAKLGEVQGTLADALEWSGINVDEFNDQLFWCNSESEREKLIRDTLNGIYSEAAEAYEVNNAAILDANDAQTKLNEATAALGEVMEPIMADLKQLLADILTPLVPKLQEFTEKHGPKIAETLETVGNVVSSVLGWIIDHWEFVSTLAIVIGTISAALSVLSAVMTVVNAVMYASPVTWIVMAIVAAVAALVAIITVCIIYWDEICAAVMTAVNAIWDGITWLVDTVVGAITTAWNWLVDLFTGVAAWVYDTIIKPVADFFVQLWEGIVNAYHTVIDPWIEIFKRLGTIIYEEVIKPIGDWFVKLWENIKGVFSTVANWFNEKVVKPIGNFFTNMWNGLKNGAKTAWEGVKNAFAPVANWFKDTFSKAWQKVKDVFSKGGEIFTGIKEGIGNAFKTVVNGLIDGINVIIRKPLEVINNALKKIKSIEIVGIKPFDWIKTFEIPQIPHLAKGGVIDSATIAMVGEAGKEAVVPLENNTEWLDKLALKLSRLLDGGSDRPIYLMVDGTVLARTSIKSINQLTKQTGKLDLILA